jgi:hypothetical protein
VAVGEVLATTRVGLAIDDAFLAFTEDIDRWWQRDPARPDAIVQFQGDRLVSVAAEGTEVLAEVAQWSPPSLVELRWHGPHSQPGDVVVVELSQDGVGTRVTIRHRRDGLVPGGGAGGTTGTWWSDRLRRLAAAHPSPARRG